MREKIGFFDLLRCVAATAVVVIHVMGPYREEFGLIPDSEWMIAITSSAFSRWAVPVFILITGALMLTDTRPFDARYYVKRRLGKVLVPFLAWSVFYAGLTGLTLAGFDAQLAWDTLLALPHHETYYHLGFFYYFIPLYFLVPFLQIFVRRFDKPAILALTGLWLVFTTLFLFKIDGIWTHQLVLYGGYLLLGYCLLVYKPPLKWVLPLGIIALLLTAYMVLSTSFELGEYHVGRWFSYKTLNTVLAATMVFGLCRYFADKLSDSWQKRVQFVARYSLGIYLLHPLFLWPVRAFDLYFAHPLIIIPFWTIIAGALSLLTTWLIARNPKTAWLVP